MIDLDALSLPRLFDELTADGSLDRVLAAAVAEDLADRGDVTTQSIVGPDRTTRAKLVTRDSGVVAGLAAVPAVLEAFGARAEYSAALGDGEPMEPGAVLGVFDGALAGLLAAERTMLNLIGRLSGVATTTRRFVDAVDGTNAVVCDTRKTTPGLRSLEKYAVRCGGGTLHRLGLHDAALFKDDHLAHLPSECFTVELAAAIRLVRRGDVRFVEVEVDTLEQLQRVLGLEPGLVDVVLLDNMGPDELGQAVALRDRSAPDVVLEASGGITLEAVRAVAATGVDRIAVGALGRSACTLDVGLDM